MTGEPRSRCKSSRVVVTPRAAVNRSHVSSSTLAPRA